MTGSNKPSTDRMQEMLGLLGRQVRLYDQLQNLADKQRALIVNENTQPLLNILSQRQKLTQELTQLGKDMAPFREHWSEVRQNLREDERKLAEDLILKANDRLKTLLASDEQDAQMLKIRKQRVGTQIGSTTFNRKAMSAYRSSSESDQGFTRLHEES